jgi:hypothetical protein
MGSKNEITIKAELKYGPAKSLKQYTHTHIYIASKRIA